MVNEMLTGLCNRVQRMRLSRPPQGLSAGRYVVTDALPIAGIQVNPETQRVGLT